jgi:hypothetical protein
MSTSRHTYDFLDLNTALPRLINVTGNTDPWTRNYAPTLTGNSIIAQRTIGDHLCPNGEQREVLDVKVLSGAELLQFVGFPFSSLRKPVHATDAILGNMAGNAFNGFVVAAILIATIPLAYCKVDDFPLSMVSSFQEAEAAIDVNDGDGSEESNVFDSE